MSDLRFYANSSYAFCDKCHQTVVPTTLDSEDGFVVVCPRCAESVSEPVDADLPEKCLFKHCSKAPTAFCVECGNATCSFHINRGDICDDCHHPGGYSTGWNSSYGM